MTNTMIVLPKKLEGILQKDQRLYTSFLGIIDPFSDILKENKLFFFPEYTDHGINHIENTLQYTENLIADDTFQHLTAKEVGVILLSTVLHDIGMHTNADMFRNMIEGKYDNLANLFPDGKTWQELWQGFLYDSQYWGEEKKTNVFGNPNYNIRIPDLSDLQGLTEYDRKLIGEFIRIHHCRVAHEIALNGYIGKKTIPFGSNDGRDSSYCIKIAGIVARSHGMNVRDTFDYLEEQFGDKQTPFNIHVVYLMVLLRLADYLQIDNSRSSLTMSLIDPIYSPYSDLQHKIHQSIKNVQFIENKEKILIHAEPDNAEVFVNIEWLVKDIQKEFDRSWAIMGEVYTDNFFKLKYRRITSNISNPKYKSKLQYVPQQFGFRYNNDLFKLLIAPLYGDDPSYGVRELIQNAVDACRLCMDEMLDTKEPDVIVKVDSLKSLFTISDRGKGMNLYEIENYFLTIGSSYNENIDWKKARDQKHIFRTGRFGIGVLAAFLIGPEVLVETRKRGDKEGYRFTASLHDRFIQIERVKDAAFGTKIQIKCDEDRLKKLKDDSCRNWYVGEKPTVVYYIDGILRVVRKDMEGYKDLNHSSENFGIVRWRPLDLFYHSSRELFCNGFFICERPRKNVFSLPGFKKFDHLEIPSLQITDIYNQLPLNLQRDNIDGEVVYDFEPELAKDVFIDTMCQVMAIDQALYRYNGSRINQVLFHHDGFSLSSEYILNCIKEKGIIKIFIPETSVSRYNIPSLISYSTILKDSNYAIEFRTVSEYEYNLEEISRVSKRLGVKDKKEQEKAFRDLVGDISFAISKDYSEEQLRLKRFDRIAQSYQGWLLVNAHSTIKRLIERIIDHPTKIPIKAIWVEDIWKRTNPNTIIDDLFDKYMHMDPVIPYKFEDRITKFPLLFKDYGDEIERHHGYYLEHPLPLQFTRR